MHAVNNIKNNFKDQIASEPVLKMTTGKICEVEHGPINRPKWLNLLV
jgi:hypothetical protein